MSIELKFKTEKDHLRVFASGEWETEPAKKGLVQIYTRAKEENQTRVFIDCMELSPPKNEMVRYFSGEALAEILKIPIKTVAVLKTEIINKFAENVAVNRGAIFFVTDNYETALEWLLPKNRIGK